MKKVIFLIEDENKCFAFFPEEKHHKARGNNVCFDGEFSACTMEYTKECKLATPDQYKDLRKELETVHNFKLEILKSW